MRATTICMSNLTRAEHPKQGRNDCASPRRRWRIPLLLGVAFAIAACQSKSEKEGAPEAAAVAIDRNANSPMSTLDRSPVPPATIDTEKIEGASAILSQKDTRVNDVPSCAMTVRYSGETEQLVTWNGAYCTELTIAFVDPKKMRSLGFYDRLSDDARDDINRCSDGRTLYVEGEFTAAIYPLNSAHLIYELHVAD